MTATDPLHAPAAPTAEPTARASRTVVDVPTRVDRFFGRFSLASGVIVLGLLLVVGWFLLIRSIPALRDQGWSFFTRDEWVTTGHAHFGVAGLLAGTVIVAAIAVVVAVPLAVCAALFITEYAPDRVKKLLTSVVDLFAAIPSLIYGLWGALVLAPKVASLSAWVSGHAGGVPGLHVKTDADLQRSFFIAGLVVALMVLPIVASVVREVFAQCPTGEKEAALALGGTRWGMIRSVVLPFGRGGIVGGSMLGLGRALGETIAVALILPQTSRLFGRILESGGGTVSGFIAQRAGGDSLTVSGLLAAGLALFALTLLTNMVASVVIARSRSGAGVDI